MIAVPASLALSDGWGLLAKARNGTGREARQHAVELVGLLRPRAFALAYRLLQDRALAEDVVQESLVRLWKSQARDQGRAQLSSYFHQIVANESLRLLKRRGRESAWAPDELAEFMDQQSEQLSSAFTVPEVATDPEALEAAISALPDRQRAALVLWAYEDATVSQISEALGLSLNATHQLLHRAKQSLRNALTTGHAA